MNALMGRNKKPKNERKSPERARDRGEVAWIAAEVDPLLALTLKDCAKKERRTKTVIISVALEEYFTRAGLWPRKEDE